MWIKTIDYLIAALGLLGHLALLLIMVRRHLLTRLPAFSLLIAFYLLRSILLLFPQFSREWPGAYWTLIYLDSGLQLLLLGAIGFSIWKAAEGMSGRVRMVLAAGCFVCIAGWIAWLIGYSSHFSPQNTVLKLSMFVSVLWLETAAVSMTLLRRKEWALKRLSVGIALGFAVYSAANLLTEIVHVHFVLVREPALYIALSYIRVIVYFACLLGWSFLFLHQGSGISPTIYAKSR